MNKIISFSLILLPLLFVKVYSCTDHDDFERRDLTEGVIYTCPKCGRKFSLWNHCMTHMSSRKHNLNRTSCYFDETILPPCESSSSLNKKNILEFGSCGLKGRRSSMEDVEIATKMELKDQSMEYDLFGIYDGHYGNGAAMYLASTLHKTISSILIKKNENISSVLEEAFLTVDENFLEIANNLGDFSGSTATILIRNNKNIITANVGDSRSILCCNNEMNGIRLTIDHKVSNKNEMKLIESKGGIIVKKNNRNNEYRLNGKLDISRSIGDYKYKEYMTSIPYISILEKKENYKFAIIASDGLWDVINDNEAIEIVNEELNNNNNNNNYNKYENAARLLATEALVRGSNDNISVLVINLNNKNSNINYPKYLS